MRASLFLLLFLLMTLCHAQESLPLSNEEEPPRRTVRIGLLSQFDTPLDNKYVYTIDGPLMRMRRTARPNLILDIQVLRQRPEIYFTAGVGYQEVNTSIDTLVRNEYLTALHLGFYDEVELDYLQLTFGLKFEPFGKSRLSPYVHPSILIGLPSESIYRVNYINSPDPDAAEFSVVEGGALASMGYIIRSGLRSNIGNRLTFNLGVYVANLSFDSDWPPVPDRPLGKDFLRLDNGGWEISLQYNL